MEETGSAEKSDWRNHGLRIFRAASWTSNTLQTGMTRAEASREPESVRKKALGGNGGGVSPTPKPA